MNETINWTVNDIDGVGDAPSSWQYRGFWTEPTWEHTKPEGVCPGCGRCRHCGYKDYNPNDWYIYPKYGTYTTVTQLDPTTSV